MMRLASIRPPPRHASASGSVTRARVERAADDDALDAGTRHRGERGDVARALPTPPEARTGIADRARQRGRRLHVGAQLGAVAAHVGVEQRRRAGVARAPAELGHRSGRRPRSSRLTATRSPRASTATMIRSPNRRHTSVQERRVDGGARADHRPRHAGLQHGLHAPRGRAGRRRPRPAPARTASTILAMSAVWRGAPAKAPSRSTTCRRSAPSADPALRHRHRIVGEHGLGVRAALPQPHAAALAQVDGGDDDHRALLHDRREVLEQPDPQLLALLGMELGRVDPPGLDRRREADAVLAPASQRDADVAHGVGLRIRPPTSRTRARQAPLQPESTSGRSRSARPSAIALEQPQRAAVLHAVPAHVRHLEPAREAAHHAGDHVEAAALAELLAASRTAAGSRGRCRGTAGVPSSARRSGSSRARGDPGWPSRRGTRRRRAAPRRRPRPPRAGPA